VNGSTVSFVRPSPFRAQKTSVITVDGGPI